jgi:hypothetical protein
MLPDQSIPRHPLTMTKKIVLPLVVSGATLLFASCAAVMTKERVAKLPAPIRTALEPMMARQDAIAKKFTGGTKKMIEGYSIVAEAIGLKIEAAKLKAQADALNAGSSLSDTRKALSRSEGLIKEVRSKMSSSKGVTVASKQRFIQGVQTKNQAYAIQSALAVEASVEAVRGVALIAKASPLDKVLLTTTLDPLFFFARDVPRFLEAERTFEETCQKYAKDQSIPLPKSNLATPKLAKVDF